MTDDLDICVSCKKPKRSNVSASLTQWMSTCVCDLESTAPDDEEIQICSNCGKRIGQARKGSLTQYIFQPEYCRCQRPKAEQIKSRDFYLAPNNEEEEEEFDENKILAVDEKKFPLERYKPIRILGEGALSTVYFCRDITLDKFVAVKVLKVFDPKELVSFQEEAKSTSQLKHRLIIEVLDFGITETNVPYMVLEYFNGETLLSFLKKHKKLEWQLTLRIMIEICTALAYSNSNGIMHRDIKPGNILIRIDKSGQPTIKVIDFGLAGLSKKDDNSVAGTPAYMSPDVPAGKAYTERSEVYSCGILLFELLTGAVPFKGDTAIETLNAHASENAPRVNALVEVPEAVAEIVSKCIAKNPQERYSNTMELRRSLEACFNESEKKEKNLTGRQVLKNVKHAISASLPLLLIVTVLGGAILFFKNVLEQSNTDKRSVSKKPVEKKRNVEDLFLLKEEKGQLLVSARESIKNSDLALLRKVLVDKERIKIHLVQKSLNGNGFKHLVNLPIEELIVDFCSLEPESGKYIKEMRNLHVLILRHSDITDDFIKNLGVHPKIKILELSGSELTDEIVPYIARFPNLRNLNLSSSRITDRSLLELAKETDLTHLSVNHNAITSTGVEALKSLPHLIFLDVSSSKKQDKNLFKAISELPSIRTLRIGGNLKIKPGDLLLLNEAPSLTEITFSELRPASKYMPFISKLNKLKKIIIDDSDLADSDLFLFLKMKNLKKLKVGMSPNLTVEALKKFEESAPEYFDFKCTQLNSSFGQYADFLK